MSVSTCDTRYERRRSEIETYFDRTAVEFFIHFIFKERTSLTTVDVFQFTHRREELIFKRVNVVLPCAA